MNINKEAMLNINNAFAELLADPNKTGMTKEIASSLSTIMKKNISVSIVQSQKSSDIMSIYPDPEGLEKVIEAIINNSNDMTLTNLWRDENVWVVELYSVLFTDKLGLSATELTALLLHEAGHIVYSNSIPLKISKVIRFNVVKMQSNIKRLVSNEFFRNLLLIPITNLCSLKTNGLREEIQADKFAINAGYKNDLISAMDKIFVYMGNNNETPEDETEDIMSFVVDRLSDLEKRNYIANGNALKFMKSKLDSPYEHHMIDKVSKYTSVENKYVESVKIEVLDKMREKVVSSYLNEMCEKSIDRSGNNIYYEGFFNKVVKMKRLDPADIDYIAIEMNNIESNDDKMMLVSYIYSKIDMIDYYISIIDSNNSKYEIPHTRDSLIQIKERLEKYKEAIINKKIPEVTYGIDVVYPAGYEG